MGNTITASENQTVEVKLDRDVLEGATLRAEAQGQSLSSVCRSILYRAAASAVPLPAPEGEEPLPHRRERREPQDHYMNDCPYRTARRQGRRYVGGRPQCTCERRFRYRIPRDAYQAAKAAIHGAGGSMTEVLESGLSEYAKTGRIVAVRP